MLAAPWPEEFGAYPALDDQEGWRRHIAQSDAMLRALVAPRAAGVGATVRERREGEALAYEVTPAGLPSNDRRVYLEIHGGALIMGAGEGCRLMATATAGMLNARVVSVDYRMPPDHPYPVGLEDCLAVYRAVLRDHQPQEIVIGGMSAGGNLAAALILAARDEGLALPAAAVLLSPELDLTESGDSFRANRGLDVSLRDGLMPANLLYAAGEDLAHPYLSPLFGDFAKGFPPTFLTAGTRDLFLSNAVRMHRALRNAGVFADLHIQEAATHASFASWPEVADIDREMRRFCELSWAGRLAR
jgi:acetyl esterase/lipase